MAIISSSVCLFVVFSSSETPIAQLAGHMRLSLSSLMVCLFCHTFSLHVSFCYMKVTRLSPCPPHPRSHTRPATTVLFPVICGVNGVCVCKHLCLRVHEFLNPGPSLCTHVSSACTKTEQPIKHLVLPQTLGFTIHFKKKRLKSCQSREGSGF